VSITLLSCCALFVERGMHAVALHHGHACTDARQKQAEWTAFNQCRPMPLLLNMNRARPLPQPILKQTVSTACKVAWRDPLRHLADVHSGIQGVPGVDHDIPAPHAYLPSEDVHLRGCVYLLTCMLRSKSLRLHCKKHNTSAPWCRINVKLPT